MAPESSFRAAAALVVVAFLAAQLYWRVLRPGGIFAGMDSTLSLGFRLLHLGDTLVTVDPDTFGARLEAAGFDPVVVTKRPNRFCFRSQAP